MPKLPKNKPLLALDTETTGVDFHHGARPFYVNFCYEEDLSNVLYWEWDVDPFTRQPDIPEEDIAEIKELLFNEKHTLVLQNPRFDAKALDSIGITEFPWKRVKDTLMAGHLLASNQPKDLTTLALIYLGINIKPVEDAIEEAVKEARKLVRKKAFKEKHGEWLIAKDGLKCMPSAKEESWKFDMWLPRAVAKAEGFPESHPWWTVLSDYANPDVEITPPLYRAQERLIQQKDLVEIYETRLKLLPVIAKMESRGVPMILPHKDELKKQYTASAEFYEKICINVSGENISRLPDNGVSKELQTTCFSHFNLIPSKTTKKGNPSLDKFVLDDWLATLERDSKSYCFVKHLLKFRKRKTALSYISSYEKYGIPDAEYPETYVRLYSSINPTGTSTLRCSSSNPNQQQISKQQIIEDGEEEGHNARYMFGPTPGREWWACDASNIELRIPAFEAGEQAMIDLFEHPDDPPYFGSNHLLFFDILHPEKFALHGAKVKKVYADTWYQWTKNGDFAVQYGAQESSGTADAAYHLPGAQRKIEERLTNIKALSERQIAMAEKTGFVETMPDRSVNPRKGYPLLCTRTKWGAIKPTIPLSYHVQGTAMWWMGKAMIRCDAFLERISNDDSFFRKIMGRSKTKAEKAGSYHIILQVHDELVFDFPYCPNQGNKPIMREIKRLMEMGGDDIGIPTPVGCEYHENNYGTGVSVNLSED